MSALKFLINSEKRGATALCFAGMYVLSVSTVVGMIKGTQLLLGLV